MVQAEFGSGHPVYPLRGARAQKHRRPERHRRWLGAEAIHGIAPDDVADAPTLDELRPRIIAAFYDALVVIYNAPFDAGLLRYELDAAAEDMCTELVREAMDG